MVGGPIGGGAEGYKGLSNLVRYCLPVKDQVEYWFIYITLERFNCLSQKEQEAIGQAAAEMGMQRYLDAEDQERESIGELRKRGVEVLEMDEATIKRMREKVKQNVWPVLRQDIGPAVDEAVNFVGKG